MFMVRLKVHLVYICHKLTLVGEHAFTLSDTPASNLGYLAPPPQDNFSWVPNCSLGPPGWETKVSSKNFGLGYVKLHGFYANP